MTTTHNPIQLADCRICGYPVFAGLMHQCSTAPKPKEIELMPIKYQDEEDEITREDQEKFYDTIFRRQKYY